MFRLGRRSHGSLRSSLSQVPGHESGERRRRPGCLRAGGPPVLHGTCGRCHGAEKVKGGLRLDSREALLDGGDTGPAVVPGEPGESLLIQAIRHEDGLEMPPKKPKLAEPTIADFETWVELRARRTRAPAKLPPRSSWPEEARRHWAFQPVGRPTPPRSRTRPGCGTRSTPSSWRSWRSEAGRPRRRPSRREWIRRVTFDLTGLPPTPEEVEAFVADSVARRRRAGGRPAAGQPALRRALGAALAGRGPLRRDRGYEYDRHIPDAWRFRDYVIDSLNRDKPFDRFLIEQIAGDEIAPDDPECQAASTFHRLGPVRRNAGNPEIALSRNEVLTERTDIIGTAFLGLTVGCARCHNHKLEPISQKDYYRLQAYLAATEEHDIVLASPRPSRPPGRRRTAKLKAEMQALQKRRRKQATGDGEGAADGGDRGARRPMPAAARRPSRPPGTTSRSAPRSTS